MSNSVSLPLVRPNPTRILWIEPKFGPNFWIQPGSLGPSGSKKRVELGQVDLKTGPNSNSSKHVPNKPYLNPISDQALRVHNRVISGPVGPQGKKLGSIWVGLVRLI